MEGELTLDAAKAMKVADLKAELQNRGLSTSGLKAALQARLIEDIEKPASDVGCKIIFHLYTI